MGSEISNVPTSGGGKPVGSVKKAKTEQGVVTKKEERTSPAKGQPAAIVQLSQNIVQKKSWADSGVSPSDMQRYLQLLKDMPEPSSEEIFGGRKGKPSSDEAIKGTVEQLGRELGLWDES